MCGLKLLSKLIGFIVLIVIVLAAGVMFLNISSSSDSTSVEEQASEMITLPAATPASEPDIRLDNIEPPPGFKDNNENVAPRGTEVKGVGVIDNGFAFIGTEEIVNELQFVTGYTVNLPENAIAVNDVVLIENPELILSLLIYAIKATGMDNQEELPEPQQVVIGNESTGVTFTTNRDGQQLRIDAVIFRRETTGALAAVIYTDGNDSPVDVWEIATEMDDRILEDVENISE